MSRIPTKTLAKLFGKANETPGKVFSAAHFDICKTEDFIQLKHYNTLIFRYYYENGYYETGGAYSLTDSRYINGMCYLLKIPAVSCVRNRTLVIDPCQVEKPKTKWLVL